jgi:hypothetical protein
VSQHRMWLPLEPLGSPSRHREGLFSLVKGLTYDGLTCRVLVKAC